MPSAPAVRVTTLTLAVAALIAGVGCATTPTPPGSPASTSRTTPRADDPVVLVQARFERLVQRLLEAEPQLSALLTGLQSAMDKPAQAAVERELLAYLTGDAFKAILAKSTPLTVDSLLHQFSPETAAALKAAQLDRPLFTLVDGLARLAHEITDMAAASEEGRALDRAFFLIRRDVLPAVVETRLLLTEEQLDANEGAALARKIEETLQSINEQLTSLQQRARSLSSPTSPAAPP